MTHLDCGELFERTARGIPGSSGWVEYHWRIPPRVKAPGDEATRGAAAQSAPDFFRGAALLSVAAFITVAGVIYAAVQVI